MRRSGKLLPLQKASRRHRTARVAAAGIGRPAVLGLRRRLESPGSLTQHLRAGCQKFSVTVLREGLVRPWPDELKALGVTRRQRMYGREVVLACDDVPVVLARSVLPERVSRLAWRAVRSLGNRPLAELLFATARVRRSALEFLHYGPGEVQMRWAQQRWARHLGTPWPTRSIWCRRSCFFLRDVPMLVMECFASHGVIADACASV